MVFLGNGGQVRCPLTDGAVYVLPDLLQPLHLGLELPDPSILVPHPSLYVSEA